MALYWEGLGPTVRAGPTGDGDSASDQGGASPDGDGWW